MSAVRNRNKRGRPLSLVRSVVVVTCFLSAFCVMGGQIVWLVMVADGKAAVSMKVGAKTENPTSRATILDRNGELMAATISAWSLYAHPHEISDPTETARRLASVIPKIDEQRLTGELGSGRNFVWIRKRMTPAEKQTVLDLGLPGIYFGRSQMRVYPGGNLATHVLGSVRYEHQGVDRTEIVGISGTERYFNVRLRDEEAPLQLSVDMRVQAALRDRLEAGIRRYGAKAGSAILMEVDSGEVHGLVSMPDFDPNRLDNALPEAWFNHAAQGVYELGSALKPITVGLAMEHDGANLNTVYDIRKPTLVNSENLSEHATSKQWAPLLEALTRSSNATAASAAMAVGGRIQKEFLYQLGLLQPVPLEISEARGSNPLYPDRWREINTKTIAFGHGIAITPLHLAAAYATLLGDGRRVRPTLLNGGHSDAERPRVVSSRTVEGLREGLRKSVRNGTGRRAEVPGYAVGGKTGTAEIVGADGRYQQERVIATFASVFPAHDPAYVLVVMLRAPQGVGNSPHRRTAGVTVAPMAGEMIARLAPLLGLPPNWGTVPRLKDNNLLVVGHNRDQGATGMHRTAGQKGDTRSIRDLGLVGSAVMGVPLCPDLRITSLASDSRQVCEGSLFAALEGQKENGVTYAGEAIQAGAAVVMTSPEDAVRLHEASEERSLSILLEPNPRRRLAQIASRFWTRQPEHISAITGTNGKTSSVCFLSSICRATGHGSASIGTLGVSGSFAKEAGPLLTTPDPIRLHSILDQAVAAGVTHLAMEASSHALAQHRLDGVQPMVAALTNVTRDHYDYHGGKHAYIAAKLRLFSEILAPSGWAVANIDDPFGVVALQIAASRGCRTLPVGCDRVAEDGIRLLDWKPSGKGSQSFRFRYRGREREVRLPFAGAFQAMNALLAAGCAIGFGIDSDEIFSVLPGLSQVRGRMELVARRENGAAVYVDYAHTPDALRVALTAARQYLKAQGRLHVLFGAGGDRDAGKRIEMGAVAAEMADLVILTDDNPRNENPEAIRRDLRIGAPDAYEIGNRGKAIRQAVAGLGAGDLLVIAGKGHEQVQETAAGVVPFDDAGVARSAVVL